MMMASRILLVGAVGLLSGCATIPVAPSMMALPGSGKSLDQFHTEDTFCRQWAAQRDQETAQGTPAGQLDGSAVRQQWYDMAYLQCMYAKGNLIPGVLSGTPPPLPTAPPPPTAGASPPPAQAP
jgi:hypothetical protein